MPTLTHNSNKRLCVVHLDLKGLPPTPDRLIELLEVFVAAGFNAVLVEWEDMFPWTVNERFRGPTCYSPKTVRQFVDRAAQLNIDLIPLVQCIGHMETPLNIPAYHPLREKPDRCDVLNVLAPGARELVTAMVDDVLQLMPNIKHLHLGGDEAWSFATHPDTKAYAEQHGKDQLYLQHVEPILDHLASSNIRPLLWHDMMIDWSDAALQALAKKADLVVWGYVGHPDDVDHHFNTRHVERFHKIGATLWAAGAYKGANSMSSDLPDIDARLTNARAWMELDERFKFQGLIATAWSRWSTHRIQNEPIDAALDAMILVGHLFKHGQTPEDVEPILQKIGELDRWQQIYKAMKSLTQARDQAWIEIRQIQENAAVVNIAPRRQGSGALEFSLDLLKKAIKDIDGVTDAVRTSFSGSVAPQWIDEYLHTRIDPLRSEHHRLSHSLAMMSTR